MSGAKRVEIDTNVRIEGDQTYSSFEHVHDPHTAPGDLMLWSVGEVVDVYEPESYLVGSGRIASWDDQYRIIYLAVDWESLRLDKSLVASYEDSEVDPAQVEIAPRPPISWGFGVQALSSIGALGLGRISKQLVQLAAR